MSAHAPSRPAAALLVWCAALLLAGCGGSHPRATLPSSELPSLALMPRDAFLAGRLDMSALRASPQWATVRQLVEDQDPMLLQVIDETSQVYFGVGGLVDAPPIPPRMNVDGEWFPQPPWADLARYFNGRLPKMVAIVAGRGAALCSRALEGVEVQERGGYRVAELEGVAVLMQGSSLCAVTWAPLVSALLAEAQAEGTAGIGGGLALAAGPDLSAGRSIAQLALDVGSPALAEALQRVTDGPRYASVQALDPEELAQLPPEEREAREATAASFAEADRTALRVSNFSRAITNLLSEGLTSVRWQIALRDDGFETRTQVEGSEERAGMWREVTHTFFGVLRAMLEDDMTPYSGAREAIQEFTEGLRIERVDGGYHIVRHTRHRSVARALQSLVPSEVPEVMGQTVEDPERARRARFQQELQAAVGLPARVAVLEAHLDYIRSFEERSARGSYIEELARSYGTLGRYGDAQTLLRAALAAELDNATADAENDYDIPEVAICRLAGMACSLAVTQGFSADALSAANTRVDSAQGTCAELALDVGYCAAEATALGGDEAEALALLDRNAQGSNNTEEYVLARARVLRAAGHPDDAFTTARGACTGGVGSRGCAVAAIQLARLLGPAATDVESAEPILEALRSQEMGAMDDEYQQELPVAVEAANCELRARLAARAPATLSACETALQVAADVHGDNHVRVAEIRAHYAQALSAARRRSEADAQRAAMTVTLQSLGPDHPLRRSAR